MKEIIVTTGIDIPKFSQWNTMINRLSKHDLRNKAVMEFVKQDLKDGHKLILPLDRIAHIDTLHEMSQSLVKNGYKVEKLTGGTPKPIRESIIERAHDGDIDLLIATRKLIYLGIDVPPMSGIYYIVPSANKENIYQEISRVRTPYKDKKTPMVRYFLDDASVSHACFNIAKKVFKELDFDIEVGVKKRNSSWE